MAKVFINEHPYLPIQIPYSMEHGFNTWYTFSFYKKFRYVCRYLFNVHIKNNYLSYRFIFSNLLRYKIFKIRRFSLPNGIKVQGSLYPKDFYIWIFRFNTETTPSTWNYLYKFDTLCPKEK